jgi:putative ABC transport system substrate-binding protein
VTDRRAFVVGGIAAIVAPLAADAQQTKKVYHVGVLTPSADVPLATFDEFRRSLRGLGYVEGQNLVIEWRFAEGQYERFPQLARDLVNLKVDVIVAVVAVAVQAAKKATPTIPIVMVAVHDPVESGLVASLARPGGNVTGLSFQGVEVVPKQLDLLKEAVPSISRVAILRNPTSPPHASMTRVAEQAARSSRIQLRALDTRSPEEFDAAFSTMAAERVGGLLVFGDGMFYLHRARLAELAAKHHLPAVYQAEQHAEAGGLLAYSADLLDSWRRAATYLDRILKGARPADLPIQQPTKFKLVINLKTARALGLTMPPSLLARADQVLE